MDATLEGETIRAEDFLAAAIRRGEKRAERVRRRSRRLSLVLASCWVALMTWWTVVGYAKIHTAEAVVLLEGAERGFIPTASNYATSFPDLDDKLDAVGVLGQDAITWGFVLGLAAISGIVICVGLGLARVQRIRLLCAGMTALWATAFAVAVVHGDTLALIMWMTN